MLLIICDFRFLLTFVFIGDIKGKLNSGSLW
jgi:hypothetical protein